MLEDFECAWSRCTSETISGAPSQNGTVGYSYDAVGNRKQITSTVAAIPSSGTLFYDTNDRTATDSYDDDGNTVASGGISNVYDFENHLVQHGAVSITYDGDGNRVTEVAGGVTTNYLVDALNPTGYAQVVDELQNGATARSYTWGSQLISKLETGNSKQSFYGFDGHGSVRYLTNSQGGITDTYDYDAFGNLLVATGSTANNYLFAGEQFDPNLNLYYNRARYLDVRSGRFWGMDPDEGDDETPSSLHKYLFDEGDPVNNEDPSGNEIDELAGALSMSITLDSMPQLITSTTTLSVRLDVGGVQVCSRPLRFSDNWNIPIPGTKSKIPFHIGRIYEHTYIKFYDPSKEYGAGNSDSAGNYHTYGILGERNARGEGTPNNQQVMKDDFERNSGSTPDRCFKCTSSAMQRTALIDGLERWKNNPLGCPSCGPRYSRGPIGAYNSNTFSYNMLFQDPAGSIQPPDVGLRAPGYEPKPGKDGINWY